MAGCHGVFSPLIDRDQHVENEKARQAMAAAKCNAERQNPEWWDQAIILSVNGPSELIRHGISAEEVEREVARRRAVHAFSARRLAIELEAVARGEDYPTAEREWPLLPEDVTKEYPFRPWRMHLPPKKPSEGTP
jgi:hypothetical protein